ncbi:MAG: hypothetical protein ACLQLO_18785, partial [Mycobacterium sp.]
MTTNVGLDRDSLEMMLTSLDEFVAEALPDDRRLELDHATIRHDLSHRADNSTRGNPTAACIEARGRDLHDAEQCRQLARAPVLDGAPRAAMRTF